MIKRFYYFNDKGKVIHLKNELLLGYLPLIWENNGLYGIISVEKVENMMQLMDDQKKLPVVQKVKEIGVFFWDEVKPLDPKIGKLIVG